ncbi:hypothetical protein MNEG_1372 [Monoraphidium neglectum]|uniref:Uncharacterized protein n=1 Tax=Monoraphidium neglectum TaxID=145388 RepID=A0A0D2NQI4_9CHLO|nr:hypothetical protein MNEG_1372 [Monoraphidium neglectum]KIZ06586.1 hypothetical protein MNEG_1372 [Monoraphidium neglectum]|eukprot:XP_013905605.1 hypothetical protein MNEG_1372 [Monoraphidium neglectum]
MSRETYGVSVEELPVIVKALARQSAAERAGGAASDDLYAARVASATVLQGVLSGSRGVPRDRAIKVVASLCDMAASDLLASPDWPRLEAALARAQAEAGADWAAFTRLVVPCLGSIEARQDYLAELVGSVAAAEHSGETDIARGWIAYLGTCFEYYEALDDLETTARRRRQQGSAADQEGLSNGSGGSGSSEGESDGGGSSGGGESGGGGDGEGESVSGGSSGGGESSSGGDGGDATSNQAAAAAGRPDDVTSCGAGAALRIRNGSGSEASYSDPAAPQLPTHAAASGQTMPAASVGGGGGGGSSGTPNSVGAAAANSAAAATAARAASAYPARATLRAGAGDRLSALKSSIQQHLKPAGPAPPRRAPQEPQSDDSGRGAGGGGACKAVSNRSGAADSQTPDMRSDAQGSNGPIFFGSVMNGGSPDCCVGASDGEGDDSGPEALPDWDAARRLLERLAETLPELQRAEEARARRLEARLAAAEAEAAAQRRTASTAAESAERERRRADAEAARAYGAEARAAGEAAARRRAEEGAEAEAGALLAELARAREDAAAAAAGAAARFGQLEARAAEADKLRAQLDLVRLHAATRRRTTTPPTTRTASPAMGPA